MNIIYIGIEREREMPIVLLPRPSCQKRKDPLEGWDEEGEGVNKLLREDSAFTRSIAQVKGLFRTPH